MQNFMNYDGSYTKSPLYSSKNPLQTNISGKKGKYVAY